MTYLFTPAQQRLSLQQSQSDEWVLFFTTQLAIRHSLSHQHSDENDRLRSGKANPHQWAVVIRRQTAEIVAYELVNQAGQADIQTHQNQERADLEIAISLF